MTSPALLALLLTTAPVTNDTGPLRDTVNTLRTLDTIDGCAVGVAGERGRFFLAASEVLKSGSLDDYRSMTADRHSVVRVMGVLGIVLQYPEAKDAIAPLLDDKAPLAWMPFGCVMEHRTVGWIVQTLQKEPSVLGLTSSGSVGPPCKRGSNDRVSYSFRLKDVSPGCSEDGVGYPVAIVVRVLVANKTTRPVILSREFSAAPYYRVAASVGQGERGEYESNGGDLEIQAGDVPEPKFGSVPDEGRFVALLPGASYETEALTGFLAGNKQTLELLAPGRAQGFVLPGQHVIRSTIRTWPYVFAKSPDPLRLRWRRIGDLVTESVETPFLPFLLQEAMTRCGSR